MQTIEILLRLQNWYAAQCNEEWEHLYGVQIGTLDNPGWTLSVDLTDTALCDKPFAAISEGLSTETQNWFVCTVENNQFVGAGGPHQLEKLITVFLDWAAS